MGPDPIRCRQELNLTDAQVDQLRQLRLEQRRAEIRRRADIELMRLDLHSLLAGAKIDEKAVSAKAKELSDLEAASHKARIDGFLAMRRVLTPEQIEKLKDLRPLHGARPDAQRPHRRGLDRGLGPSGEGLSRDEVALTADENE